LSTTGVLSGAAVTAVRAGLGDVGTAVGTGVGAAATAVGTGSIAAPRVTPKTMTETIAVGRTPRDF
jgi:hypothetical protein